MDVISFVSWLKFPFLRYIPLLIIGVTYYDLHGYVLSDTVTTVLLVSLTIAHVVCGYLYESPLVSGTIFLLWLLTFGNWYAGFRDITNSRSHISNLDLSVQGYKGVILSATTKEQTKQSYVLSLNQLLSEDELISTHGKLVLFVHSDTAWEEGSTVIVRGAPELIPSIESPYEFNYKEFMLRAGVTHRHFIRSKDVRVLNRRGEGQIPRFLRELRRKAEQTLDSAIAMDRERSVLRALLIGDKSQLKNETKQAYADTGVMHILAVSGLHVGIIYMMLIQGFGRAPLIRKSKVTKQLTAIALLWLFAGITGFSSSVVRSVTMFSLYGIGDLCARKASVYNTVSLAAFAMILVSPSVVFDVGFQFTFMAVMGILYLQPRIFGLFVFKNRLLDWIWSLTSVGVAAQLATFPIALHVFGIFPNYFLISNLIGIPLAIASVNLGVILLLLYSSRLFDWLAWILERLVFLGNEILFVFSQIPFSTTHVVDFSLEMVFLTYAVMLSIIQLVNSRKLHYLFLLVGFTCCLIYFDAKQLRKRQQARIVQYNVGSPCIDFFQGSKMYSICDHVKEIQLTYSVLPIRTRYGNKGPLKMPSLQIGKNSRLLVWQSQKVLLLRENISLNTTLDVDILIKMGSSLSTERITSGIEIDQTDGFIEYTLDQR